MKRFGVIIVLITLSIFAGGIYLFSRSNIQSVPPLTGYEYYWGNGCPHCEVVDEFLQSWEGEDKYPIEKREVWYNKSNAQIMVARGDVCGIARSQMAVPLLVTPQGECIQGDEPIIEHLKGLE